MEYVITNKYNYPVAKYSYDLVKEFVIKDGNMIITEKGTGNVSIYPTNDFDARIDI